MLSRSRAGGGAHIVCPGRRPPTTLSRAWSRIRAVSRRRPRRRAGRGRRCRGGRAQLLDAAPGPGTFRQNAPPPATTPGWVPPVGLPRRIGPGGEAGRGCRSWRRVTEAGMLVGDRYVWRGPPVRRRREERSRSGEMRGEQSRGPELAKRWVDPLMILIAESSPDFLLSRIVNFRWQHASREKGRSLPREIKLQSLPCPRLQLTGTPRRTVRSCFVQQGRTDPPGRCVKRMSQRRSAGYSALGGSSPGSTLQEGKGFSHRNGEGTRAIRIRPSPGEINLHRSGGSPAGGVGEEQPSLERPAPPSAAPACTPVNADPPAHEGSVRPVTHHRN